jgi:hypothetical protein
MEPDPLDRADGQDAGWGAASPQKRLQRKKEQKAFRRTNLLHLKTRSVWAAGSAWAEDVVVGGLAWDVDVDVDVAVDLVADKRSEPRKGCKSPKKHLFRE